MTFLNIKVSPLFYFSSFASVAQVDFLTLDSISYVGSEIKCIIHGYVVKAGGGYQWSHANI